VKIALIRKKYTPFGGAERYIDALIGQLLDLGHEVHIFANEWQIVNAERKAQNGKLFFHNVPMIKGLSVLKVLSFALSARRLVKKERFDVIHSFEGFLIPIVLFSSWARALNEKDFPSHWKCLQG